MVSDEDIAKGVESLLRETDPSSITTLNGVVQQLEARLGLNLSHKAGFIRDQIDLLLRSHPPQAFPPPTPKDPFALHNHPQFPSTHPHHFPSHFALHPGPPSDEINFRQPPPPPATAQPPQSQSHSHPGHAPPQPPVVKGEAFVQHAAAVAPEVPKER